MIGEIHPPRKNNFICETTHIAFDILLIMLKSNSALQINLMFISALKILILLLFIALTPFLVIINCFSFISTRVFPQWHGFGNFW